MHSSSCRQVRWYPEGQGHKETFGWNRSSCFWTCWTSSSATGWFIVETWHIAIFHCLQLGTGNINLSTLTALASLLQGNGQQQNVLGLLGTGKYLPHILNLHLSPSTLIIKHLNTSICLIPSHPELLLVLSALGKMNERENGAPHSQQNNQSSVIQSQIGKFVVVTTSTAR